MRYSVIVYKSVKVESSSFLYRIPAQPPSRAGVVIAVAVINRVRLIILVFSGEPEGVELGHGACGADGFSKRSVFILGGDRAVGGVLDRAGVMHRVRHVESARLGAAAV